MAVFCFPTNSYDFLSSHSQKVHTWDKRENSCVRDVNYSIELTEKPLENEASWSRENDLKMQYKKHHLNVHKGLPQKPNTLTESPGDFDIDVWGHSSFT